METADLWKERNILGQTEEMYAQNVGMEIVHLLAMKAADLWKGRHMYRERNRIYV